MSRRLEHILLNSPHPVRTLAANMKSWQLDRMRRGGNAFELRQQYGPLQYRAMSLEAIWREQNRRFLNLLSRATKYTPYYKPWAQDFIEIRSIDQIVQLPTLTKSQAREAGTQLYDSELQRKTHYTGHTSGTTGSPFTFKWTLDALRIRYALRDNFYALHGFDFSSEVNLRLGGRLFVPTSQRKPPFWIYDRVTKQLMFSLYHMSDDNLTCFIDPLLRHQPTSVTGYPSAIYLFAKFCGEHQIDWRPKGVFTDSETVLDHHRKTISSVWDCKIHDSYGMEVGWIAGQCEHGKYHLSPLTSIVEILDESGRPVVPGELGEIVATDLTNPLMPLIRYRTGDAGAWSASTCPCGWNTPTLESIEGRVDDVVVLPNGRKIGRLDHVFKQASHIRECQIIQETPGQFVFLVVPDEGYSSVFEKKILKEAYARLGSDVTIVVKHVNAIERTSGGKFRSVISRVNPNQ